MVKHIIIVVAMVLCIGCDGYTEGNTARSGNLKVKTVCIDGVEYIKMSTGYGGYMSPHYKKDGTLYLCD